MAILPRVARATGGLSSPISISTTGVVAGDRVLLHVRTTSNVVPSVPAGFTLITGASIGNLNSIYIYEKVAGGSEPSTYDVTFSSGTARLGLLAIYSDTGNALQLDGVANQSNAASTTYQCPSITTTIAGALLCCFLSINSTVTVTPPGGMTQQYDTTGVSTVAALTETLSGTGSTGTRSPTGSGSQTSRTVTMAWAETPGIHGTAAITLDALTLVATGTVAIKGAAAITLDPLTLVATGSVPVQAGANITLAPLTLVATGKVAIKGAAAITLAPLTLAASALGPPFVPTDFSAVAISGSRIDLSWSDDGPSISGFNIERSPTGVGSWVQIATVGAAVRAYTDDGLAQGTTYWYRMRARRD